MPTYVYGCDKDEEHPTQTIYHSILEDPEIKCGKCGSPAHRIPQIPLAIGYAPFDILVEKQDAKMEEYLKRRKRSKKNGRAN